MNHHCPRLLPVVRYQELNMSVPVNRTNDIPELQAIVFASHVLKTFKDNEARVRVLRGVCKYFGLNVSVAAPGLPAADSALDVPAFEELVAVAASNSQRFTQPVDRDYAFAVR